MMIKKRIKLTNPPCFMGLDMSVNGTGVCIFDSKQKMVHVEVIEPKEFKSPDVARCIKSSQRISDFSRYREVVTRIIKLVIAYRVVGIVIENYAFGIRRSKSLTKLGELGGIIRDKLIDRDVHWIEVTPQSVKKFITGKGACPEAVLLLKVSKKWNEEFDSVKDRRKIDAAIAYGLSRIAWNLYSEKAKRDNLLEYEQQVLKNIEKKEDVKKS